MKLQPTQVILLAGKSVSLNVQKFALEPWVVAARMRAQGFHGELRPTTRPDGAHTVLVDLVSWHQLSVDDALSSRPDAQAGFVRVLKYLTSHAGNIQLVVTPNGEDSLEVAEEMTPSTILQALPRLMKQEGGTIVFLKQERQQLNTN